MRKTIRYERQPCNRCGGSGRYSYNQIDGDRCYGCGGAGVTLSSAGVAARERVEALKAEMLTIPVTDVEVGEWARVGRYYGIVLRAERTGRSSGKSLRDGVMVELPEGFSVKFNNVGVQTNVEATAQRKPTEEEWDTIADFAAGLPGAEVAEKD